MRPTNDKPADVPPRLGIGHLLLWVTCCAVYLAFLRQMTDTEPGLIGLAIVSLLTAGSGAALAGLAIFLTRRLRRVRWPISPGEWLLAAFGARLAAELVLHRWLVPDYVRAPAGILAAITCCMLMLPLLSRHVSIAWKVYLFFVLLLFAGPLVRFFLAAFDVKAALAWLFPYRWAILPLPAILLSIHDRRRGRRHDWLHWLGVGVFVWYLAVLALFS